MKTIYQKLNDLETKSTSKSITKFLTSIILLSVLFSSCKKENVKTETWQFTKLVNATLDNDGYMVTLDFYQKKGNEWRIVQMSPDDFTIFNLKGIITPDAYQLPIDNSNAFVTSNIRLFSPADNKVYNQGNLRWLLGDPIQFKTFNTFGDDFPDMPAAYNSISKFSAATFSLEQAYDNNSKTNTYIFYDFPNQKYVYYGFRTGADLILENSLPLLCTTCNTINWKNIDAVTCTGKNDNGDFYYFFDFDAQKMHILYRDYKNTNHPSFSFDTGLTMDFADAFKGKSGTAQANQAFDFNN